MRHTEFHRSPGGKLPLFMRKSRMEPQLLFPDKITPPIFNTITPTPVETIWKQDGSQPSSPRIAESPKVESITE